MDVERMRAYCAAKSGAWADNPWELAVTVAKSGTAPTSLRGVEVDYPMTLVLCPAEEDGPDCV